ncbi:MAG: TlpA family protein disulfide reductase [Chloroflexia bacterium]
MSDPPGSAGRSRWKLWLAGVGLFAAGGIIGALTMLSVFLYRLPAAPSAAPIVPTTHAPERTLSPSSLPTTPPSAPSTLPVGPAVGQVAPLFTLPATNGTSYALESFRGRTVLLHFWASWCPPCRQEWPEWLAFGTAVSDTVAILAVNVEETPEAVRGFIGEQPLPFPVLLDSDGMVGEMYRVTALPTTFLIDAQGVVQQVVPGNVGREALERLIAH